MLGLDILTFLKNRPLMQVKKFIFGILFLTGLISNQAVADELEDISKLIEQRQITVALTRVNALLAKNPQNPQAQFTKGVILVEAGKRDEAIKTFNNLTVKYPNLPEPYNNLAVLYAESGQYDKARIALDTAIKKQPNYAAAHENLGDLYAHMASESYDKALQHDTSNGRTQSKLSIIKVLFEGGNQSTSGAIASESNKSMQADVVSNTAATAANNKKEPVSQASTVDLVKPKAPESIKVIEFVNRWSKAWASKDVEKYLASYTDTFKPPSGEGRKDWENSRRERIKRASNITSEVINQKVSFESNNKATINFNQIYRTDGKPMYRADGEPVISNKTLGLKRINGNWLIDQESTTN